MIRPSAKRAMIRFSHVLVSFCLVVSATLPWFELPVFGWQVPVPAWNRVGLSILILSGICLVRGLGFSFVRWPARLVLPLAAYGWWTSPEAMRDWGVSLFAPLQLKFSSINSALSHLNVEPITVFESQLWRELSTGPGFALAGLSFAALLLVTAFDHPKQRKCSACQSRVQLEDRNCHSCGALVSIGDGCRGCGKHVSKSDKHCRHCGQENSKYKS